MDHMFFYGLEDIFNMGEMSVYSVKQQSHTSKNLER